MQKMLSYMRKAIQEFDLIQDGDRILVGVSGGKDSLVLLNGLVLLRRFIGIEYTPVAATLDPVFYGTPGNYEPVREMCEKLKVEYHVIPTRIGQIVFDIRKEEHPCSLCAKLRRGGLHQAANDLGCNKVALGHNNDDAAETFLMNLFIQGRIGCFAPKSYLTRRDLTVIRPLVLAPEKEVQSAAARNGFPVVKSKCPADGHTARAEIKEFIESKNRELAGFTQRVFGAMRRYPLEGWGIPGHPGQRNIERSVSPEE